jgi:hypothetical protein
MLKLQDLININELNSYYLSRNPNAIELLRENQDKIDWWRLSQNPTQLNYYKKTKIK